MAPAKPMGTKPGVTGFPQEYNQDPGPRQDLNPDAVTADSVLPKPLPAKVAQPAKAPKTARASKRTKK